MIIFFFFSSRRRHTRFKCDWSSDVCSSDLSCHHLLESTLTCRHDIKSIWRTEFVSVQFFSVKPVRLISDATKQPRHRFGAGMFVIFDQKNRLDTRYGRPGTLKDLCLVALHINLYKDWRERIVIKRRERTLELS